MKDVQCYELFGRIALKNHAFSFHFISSYCGSVSNSAFNIISLQITLTYTFLCGFVI